MKRHTSKGVAKGRPRLKNCQAMDALRPQRPLIFDFGKLKLYDVAKFCFFKLIMTKSNFKKSVITSF